MYKHTKEKARNAKTHKNSCIPGKDGSWSHLTKTVNPLTCTIEYGSSTGFSSEEEARESYHNSIMFYQNQLYELKKNRNVSFTFSEYLDYWFRDIYTPSSSSSSTLIKYQWVLYQIILPHLQEDVLLGCVKKEFLNKLLDSCQESNIKNTPFHFPRIIQKKKRKPNYPCSKSRTLLLPGFCLSWTDCQNKVV